LQKIGKADPLQPLEDQVRGPIAAANARADEAHARDGKEIGRRFPLGTLRLEERDGKHSMLL
jgi:hypothetical protein